MTIKSDIAAIKSDASKSPRQKQLAEYQYKADVLADIIINGKPAPQPIPPLLGRTFTLNGTTILVHNCMVVSQISNLGDAVPKLYVDLTLTRAPAPPVRHQVFYTCPPPIPRSETGNEKQDLIQAASELLALLPVT